MLGTPSFREIQSVRRITLIVFYAVGMVVAFRVVFFFLNDNRQYGHLVRLTKRMCGSG